MIRHYFKKNKLYYYSEDFDFVPFDERKILRLKFNFSDIMFEMGVDVMFVLDNSYIHYASKRDRMKRIIDIAVERIREETKISSVQFVTYSEKSRWIPIKDYDPSASEQYLIPMPKEAVEEEVKIGRLLERVYKECKKRKGYTTRRGIKIVLCLSGWDLSPLSAEEIEGKMIEIRQKMLNKEMLADIFVMTPTPYFDENIMGRMNAICSSHTFKRIGLSTGNDIGFDKFIETLGIPLTFALSFEFHKDVKTGYIIREKGSGNIEMSVKNGELVVMDRDAFDMEIYFRPTSRRLNLIRKITVDFPHDTISLEHIGEVVGTESYHRITYEYQNAVLKEKVEFDEELLKIQEKRVGGLSSKVEEVKRDEGFGSFEKMDEVLTEVSKLLDLKHTHLKNKIKLRKTEKMTENG